MNKVKYNMNGCTFINDNENKHMCGKHIKFGTYCWRHRKNHLLDKDNNIIIENFTHSDKDYTFKEIKDYYIKHHFKKGEKKTKLTKEHCFLVICKSREIHNHYTHPLNQKKLLIIQRHFKENQKKKYELFRGPGFNDRKVCNNDEDFYTFEELEQIECKYFFTYKDQNNHIWGFDLRSLKKLIDMNYDNPYTTEKIPENIKELVNSEIGKLSAENQSVSIQQEVVADRKTAIKQRITDLFTQIEMSGYSCSVEWLLDLPIYRLKKLYRYLEDIWNYRAGLSIHVKRRIAPPDGRVFVYPVQEINNYTNKLDLLDVITNEVFKFTRAQDINDQKLGFMYFIIGLGHVSHNCYITHSNWLNFI